MKPASLDFFSWILLDDSRNSTEKSRLQMLCIVRVIRNAPVSAE
jgi:hypothetical protein